MSDGHDYLALDWVRGEIEATLKQAQQSLEAFVENPEDTTRMRFCLTYIHQVHGTLQMVEFYGAALLAEEMECVAQALMNDAVNNLNDALEVLMRAILQLPPYLERVKTNRKDLPVVLLPLLNDLRAARGESLMSETAMFNPDLSAASSGVSKAVDQENEKDFVALLKKVRQAYQIALVGLIRNQSVPASLKRMNKVMRKLSDISGNSPIAPLWSIGQGIVEGLLTNNIETGTSIKVLMGGIDRQIKLLAEGGSSALNEPVPKSLLKNLLYYIAKSEADTPLIKKLKKQYRLSEALPSEEQVDEERLAMSGPDKDTMNTVVMALSEELNEVKESLDLFMRSIDRKLAELEPLELKLKQVSDTIAVLGMGQQRKIIQDQGDVLRGILDSGEMPDDDVLMDIAGSVLYVESTLAAGVDQQQVSSVVENENDISPEHLNAAHESVLREGRAGLEKAKDAVIEFIASQWQQEHLEGVPALLTGVRGGLEIVGLKRPATLLNKCVEFIENDLLVESNTPQWTEMDTLADAITSVEYYLERLADDSDTDDYILEIAEESVAELGYPLNETEKQSLIEEAEPNIAAEDSVTAEAIEDQPIEDVISEPEQEPPSSPEIEIPVLAAVETDEDTGFEAEPDEAPAVEQTLTEELEETTAPEIEKEQEEKEEPQVESKAEPVPAVEYEDDLIDEEIIEIFVEEVEEVLETLEEFFPKWVANMDDEDSLTEFRRGFHTLKGSGRMVGATVVGELSWSIENMLNRVIDKTVVATPFMVDLITRVTEMIPALVGAFEKQTTPPYDTEPFMEVANALAAGESVDVLPEISSAGSSVKLGEEPSEDEAEIEVENIAPEIEEESPVSVENEEPVGLTQEIAEEAMNSAETEELPESTEEIAQEEIVQEEIAQKDRDSAVEEYGTELVEEIAEPFTANAEENAEEEEGLDETLIEATEATTEDWQEEYPAGGEDFADAEMDAVSLKDFGLGFDEGAEESEFVDLDDSELVTEKEIDQPEEVDQTLISLFQTETESNLEIIQKFIAQEQNNVDGIEIDDQLLKALHTLKGSANMANIDSLVIVIKPTEQFLKQLRDNRQLANQDIITLLSHFIRLIREALPGLEESLDNKVDGSLAYQAEVEAISEAYEIANAKQRANMLDSSAVSADAGLISTFLAQGMDFILEAEEIIADWRKQADKDFDVEFLLQELSRLTVGAREANLLPIAEISEVLVNCYHSVKAGKTDRDDNFFEAVADGHEELINMMDYLAASQTIKSATNITEQIKALTAEEFVDGIVEAELLETQVLEIKEFEADTGSEIENVLPDSQEEEQQPSIVEDVVESANTDSEKVEAVLVERDPELVEIFLEEADEIIETVTESLDKWMEDANNLLEVQSLQRDLHTLKGGARMIEFPELGDIAHELEFLYEALCEGRLTAQPSLFDLLHRCHDRIAEMVDALRQNTSTQPAVELMAQITAYISDPSGFDPAAATVELTPVETQSTREKELEDEGATSIRNVGDTEILGIFMVEVDELTEGMDRNISQWLEDKANPEHIDDLKRILHTLKGGARLAGLGKLGDTSHDFETFLLEAQSSSISLDSNFFAKVHEFQDVISAEVENAKGLVTDEVESTMLEDPQVEQPAEPAQESNIVPLHRAEEDVSQAIEKIQQSLQKKASPQEEETPAQKRQQPQEMVRVPADLLERLVNLAGETSITRGRVEQSVNDFSFSLEDMGSTIERLAEQLRRMDKETEEQILSSYNQAVESGQFESGTGQDFDPLEMDEYSQLQQLSKALAESASDLVDIKETLLNRSRDTETILIQQARVNTELQEGLMRTRMVPFSRLVPRLRRIVRQIGGEVNKVVELNVINPEGELDRTLLEKIVAPLEHMLRNAVDHGIEDSEGRAMANKNATGQVNLEISREGGDVVMTLTDDGKGIDVDAVRKKAIERGLIEADSQMPDQEVMQFILQAGFSTAQAVTQISGRGVGMDVVSSEIKQMGGSLSINSVKGEGTLFTLRLPFTVAMNKALLVGVGEDTYAIPLNQIEGIVRVSPFELDAYYSGEAEEFDYAGLAYKLVYMGHYVHDKAKPNLDGLTAPLPVLLVSVADYNVAIQVDTLMGAREVVVKSIGPQLASVSGISGATILGDGSVVIILDVSSMVRADAVTPEVIEHTSVEEVIETPPAPDVAVAPVIMVTDDSVTVRKVTGRFLERQGFEVVTAKDGIDALSKLEDFKPDLMLLDIEMPRMDGFEVATHVRHEERLKDIPIIMITSRTGEKHRERAFGIGVNAYLGKPFQEGALLETIKELLEKTKQAETETIT